MKPRPRHGFFLVEARISPPVHIAIEEVYSSLQEDALGGSVVAWLCQLEGLEDISRSRGIYTMQNFTSSVIRHEFRSEEDFALEALRINGLALEHVPLEFRGQKEMCLGAVAQNGESLAFASEEMRDTFSVVLAAVQQCGEALRFASEDMRSDSELVVEAVRQSGIALQFALDEAREDQEVVQVAVRQNPKALRFAAKVSSQAMKEAVREDWRAAEELLNLAQPPTQAQIEEIVVCNPKAIKEPRLRGNRPAALAAVRQDGLVLKFVAPELRKDRELIEAAMHQNPLALWEAAPVMRSDVRLTSLYNSGPMQAKMEALAQRS